MGTTMQDFPLTVTHLFRHGQQVHARSEVVSFDGESISATSYAEVAERTERLAGALAGLGIERGDRVGTLMWNSQEHLEAYFAVPCMGAVLHTLNLRLPPADLGQIMAEAGDRVVIAHASLLPLLLAAAGEVPCLETVLVAADPGLPAPALGRQGAVEYAPYEDALSAAGPWSSWPELEERSPCAICYTSGTTDLPRGVVYSHRSTFLHALCTSTGAVFSLGTDDAVLPLVPMFHVNAWGIPYASWMQGATIVMPHRWLMGGPVCKLIKLARPTAASGVPTIWASLLEFADEHPSEVDFSSLRLASSGGAALPRAIMETFRDRWGVQMGQGWGMTETSPVCTYTLVGGEGEREDKPLSAGRIVPGVEMRVVTPEGDIAPRDGSSVGEIEVRGPWVTASYIGEDEQGARGAGQFHDGWLRTGDIGTLDEDGYLTISDRLKDVVKSGGEWISSLRLENELMAHPGVAEAAVVAVPDDRWGERPMAFVVLRRGATVGEDDLKKYLDGRVPHWWAPGHWAFVAEIPKTSVGKYDKVALRARFPGG
ncbi:MAG: long-chain-fatty-acid--CoA ligase [Acidimicrobiales bacterium]